MVIQTFMCQSKITVVPLADKHPSAKITENVIEIQYLAAVNTN